MAPSAKQHRRAHNLLLLNNLIGHQSTISPFTLVLDTLEQTARPLLAEYIQRAGVRAQQRHETARIDI